mmetsp:Transcript_51921/g.145793  ORF Transcript_51921/g.145793 Transcript_51921/m.145793 type:complete len:222 (-) Transcript_51921:2355-3020(-)
MGGGITSALRRCRCGRMAVAGSCGTCWGRSSSSTHSSPSPLRSPGILHRSTASMSSPSCTGWRTSSSASTQRMSAKACWCSPDQRSPNTMWRTAFSSMSSSPLATQRASSSPLRGPTPPSPSSTWCGSRASSTSRGPRITWRSSASTWASSGSSWCTPWCRSCCPSSSWGTCSLAPGAAWASTRGSRAPSDGSTTTRRISERGSRSATSICERTVGSQVIC